MENRKYQISEFTFTLIVLNILSSILSFVSELTDIGRISSGYFRLILIIVVPIVWFVYNLLKGKYEIALFSFGKITAKTLLGSLAVVGLLYISSVEWKIMPDIFSTITFIIIILELRKFINFQIEQLQESSLMLSILLKKPPLIATAVLLGLLTLFSIDNNFETDEEIAIGLFAMILLVISFILFFVIKSRLKTYPKESNLPELGNTFVWYAVALIVIMIVDSFDTTFTSILSSIIGLAVSLLLTLNILNVFLPDEEENKEVVEKR